MDTTAKIKGREKNSRPLQFDSRLEVNPEPKFHRAWVAALGTEHAPGSWRRRIEGGIQELVVVEQVSEHGLERETDPLRSLDVLHHTHIHVPVRHAAKNAVRTFRCCPAYMGSDAQDRRCSQVIGGQRIAENVDLGWGVGTGSSGGNPRSRIPSHAVMGGRAVWLTIGEYTTDVGEKARGVGGTELLPAIAESVCHAAGQRQTASSGEDGRERPSTEQAADDALLPFEQRWLVYEEHVVYELTVEVLITVLVIQVIRIVGSIFTGRLHESTGSQRLTPGEV